MHYHNSHHGIFITFDRSVTLDCILTVDDMMLSDKQGRSDTFPALCSCHMLKLERRFSDRARCLGTCRCAYRGCACLKGASGQSTDKTSQVLHECL